MGGVAGHAGLFSTASDLAVYAQMMLGDGEYAGRRILEPRTVQIMTRGGPANATSVLANLMYIQAFNNYKMGEGAATAVILFAISFVFIVFYLWRVMRDELEY